MATALPTDISRDEDDIAVRRIGIDDLRIALRQGIDDFRERRGDLIFLGLIYPLVGIVAALVALRQDAVQFAFPLLAGVALLGPAVATIFYEMARRRESGEDTSWGAAFGLMRRPSFEALVALAGLLVVIFILWLIAAWAIYSVTLGPQPPSSLAAFARDLFGTGAGWALIIVGNLVGLAFAATALAVGVVSFPMLVDRPVSASTALATSMRATAANPVPVALWGLMVAAVLVVAAIPFLIGLAIAVPVLGYATWHLYTRMVER